MYGLGTVGHLLDLPYRIFLHIVISLIRWLATTNKRQNATHFYPVVPEFVIPAKAGRRLIGENPGILLSTVKMDAHFRGHDNREFKFRQYLLPGGVTV